MQLEEISDSIRVVAIQFNGRSGSVLLSNLFDSAEGVISCPPDSLTGDILPKLGNMIIQKNINSWIDEIIDLAPNLFEHDDDVNTGMGTNKVEFKRYFETLFNKVKSEINSWIDEKRDVPTIIGIVFKLIHVAYARSKGIDVGNKFLIVWQLHMPLFTKRALIASKSFKQLTCITCVRHPLFTLDSHFLSQISINGLENSKQTFLAKRLALSYYNSLRQWGANEGINHIAVRFEDMHLFTESLMQNLCNYLNISYSSNMNTTTLDGKIYYFQGAKNIVTGTNLNITKNKQCKVFTSEDIVLLKHLLWPIGDFYNYKFDDIQCSENTVNVLSNKTRDDLEALKVFMMAGCFKSFPMLIKPNH